MSHLFRYALSFILVTALLSCAPSTPPTEATEDIMLDGAPQEMPADQTQGGRNATPETVAPERLEEAEVRETPPVEQLGKAVESKITAPERAAEPQPQNPAPVSSSAPATAPTTAGGSSEAEKPVAVAPPVKEPTTVAEQPPAPAASTERRPATGSSAPDHAPWNAILKQYVNSQGRVDYASLKRNERKLDAYLASLEKEIPQKDWSRNERLAYWLNAYNAYTFKLILDNYPVNSITDLHAGKPWDVKWIALAGKTCSLNDIEHKIIRPRFKDPRIHFAVVCAAESCPPLANEAFNSRNLNGLLDTRARQFINNSVYNLTTGDPKISKIFEWYAEDFGDVKEYLNKYLKEPIPANAELGYMDYDWSLNKQ